MDVLALGAAREIVAVDVTDLSEAARRELREAIDTIVHRGAPAEAPQPVNEPTGWSSDLLGEVFVLLAAEGAATQLEAVRRAIANGGEVSRAEVYELGNYNDSRSLKGFTRPSNRVTQKLRNKGLIPKDAPKLLEPIYPKAAKGYARTLGFRIPPELLGTPSS